MKSSHVYLAARVFLRSGCGYLAYMFFSICTDEEISVRREERNANYV